MIAKGTPEGNVNAAVGSLYLDSNAGLIYEKQSDSEGKKRGWVCIGRLVDAGGDYWPRAINDARYPRLAGHPH